MNREDAVRVSALVTKEEERRMRKLGYRLIGIATDIKRIILSS